MSRHEVEKDEKRYVFGWDQPLLSFFLLVHDLTKDEDDEDRIPVWLGADKDTKMSEVEDLVVAAQRHGLHIFHPVQVRLKEEKDNRI